MRKKEKEKRFWTSNPIVVNPCEMKFVLTMGMDLYLIYLKYAEE